MKTIHRHSITIAYALALSLAGMAAAQEPAGGAGKVRVTSEKQPAGLDTKVSLDADDAFLPKILSVLAEISGYNVVSGPEVNNRQRISIHLKSTPVEEAVNLVVRAAGLSYEIVGNSFLVTGADNLKKEVGVSSYVVELEYARAQEMKAMLKDITANVQVDTGRNALLVSTSPKAISEIRRVVELVDVPSKQIMLRTRVIEVAVDKVKALGIDWQRLSSITTILAEDGYDPRAGGVVPPAGPTDQIPSAMPYQKLDGLDNIGYFSRQLKAFDLTLDVLMKDNDARLLTDTKLTTLNNRRANILIGDVIPFIVPVAAGGATTGQVERDSIGIKLEITPQINNSGFITATIKPEVSTFVDFVNNSNVPRKKTRAAETTVLVRDRQKIYIAGLTKTDATSTIHKVPFLGDLLFVGKWFQHESKEETQTDLIIEITPYILNNSEDVRALMADSLFQANRALQQAQAAKPAKDPSGLGPTRLALLPAARVLKPYQYVVSAHEIAAGQDGNFQITYSPWQQVGRIRWGLKYAPAPGVALGLGYSGADFDREAKYDLGRRLGLYLSKTLVGTAPFEWYGILDAQLGSYDSYGGGTGFSVNFGPWLSWLAEAEENYTPYTPHAGTEYWDPNATTALRWNWPWLPGLSLDGGVTFRVPTYLDRPLGDATGDWRHGDAVRADLRRQFQPMAYFDLTYAGMF